MVETANAPADTDLVRESLALLKAFQQIDDPKLRRGIRVLVEQLATNGTSADISRLIAEAEDYRSKS